MKRILVFLSFAVVLLAGCHREVKKIKKFETNPLCGEQCYILTLNEEIGPWGKVIGIKNSYNVVWPAEGMMTPEALRELMYIYFGDSTVSNVDEATKQWLASVDYFNDDETTQKQLVDSLDASYDVYSYSNIESSCRQDSNLATFTINRESYGVGAAHGMYSVDYLTVDVEKGSVIHLCDLVDTNQLGEVIVYAINDLEVNKDVRDCLFEEFKDAKRMPVPHTFFIDSTRSTITVVYGLYEVACYASGIQSVVLPIFWLSKHIPLTPYAKELFGPDSYQVDNK